MLGVQLSSKGGVGALEVQDRLDPLTLRSFLLVAPKYQAEKKPDMGI